MRQLISAQAFPTCRPCALRSSVLLTSNARRYTKSNKVSSVIIPRQVSQTVFPFHSITRRVQASIVAKGYMVNTAFIASAVVLAAAEYEKFDEMLAEDLLELIKVRTGFSDYILRNFTHAILSEFKKKEKQMPSGPHSGSTQKSRLQSSVYETVWDAEQKSENSQEIHKNQVCVTATTTSSVAASETAHSQPLTHTLSYQSTYMNILWPLYWPLSIYFVLHISHTVSSNEKYKVLPPWNVRKNRLHVFVLEIHFASVAVKMLPTKSSQCLLASVHRCIGANDFHSFSLSGRFLFIALFIFIHHRHEYSFHGGKFTRQNWITHVEKQEIRHTEISSASTCSKNRNLASQSVRERNSSVSVVLIDFIFLKHR